MRITSLRLQNFKRFTDLTIEGIPESAKLVLLIGANGSGKSSVFDALWIARHPNAKGAVGFPMPVEYYSKQGFNPNVSFTTDKAGSADFQVSTNGLLNKRPASNFRVVGRPSIRIVPRITNEIHLAKIEDSGDGPAEFIDPDTRFSTDVFQYMQQVDNALREPVFSGKSSDTFKIFQDFIRPLNESLLNIFGEDISKTIQLSKYVNFGPRRNGQLIFRKGEVEISYDLLSHGEKQVVILLLNFVVRKQYYEDAIIFIDEMDAHLNTSLQQALIHEIVTRWIPDSSQFWTASHALGFIDYARKSKEAVIIDFDALDFDQLQILRPMPKESLEIYEIAIPKETIASILTDKKLVAAENKNSALFNLALGARSYLFLPANNNREVFLTIRDQPNMLGLRDRDYLRDDEREAIMQKFPNLKILHYYTFENYIYHPNNLSSLVWPSFNRSDYVADITQQKNARREAIIDSLAEARQTYVEFKEGIKDDKDRTMIIAALKSDDFETFYPYFNMKTHYDKSYLSQFSYEQKDLVQTDWFRENILAVLQ